MRRDKNKNRHKKRFITQKSTINPKQSTKNTIGRKNKKQRKIFFAWNGGEGKSRPGMSKGKKKTRSWRKGRVKERVLLFRCGIYKRLE